VRKHRWSMLVSALLALTLCPSLASADPTGVVSPDIVGGTPATQQYGAFAIWDPSVGRSRCTGTVIATEDDDDGAYWGVTAAHCGQIITPGVTEIRASVRDISAGWEPLGVAEFIPHPDFDETNYANDVALIRFAKPAKRTTPVAIAHTSVGIGTVTRIAGWGWTCDAAPTDPACGTTARVLQQLDTRIVPDSRCPLAPQPSQQSCEISADGKPKQGCPGDSGAPVEQLFLDKPILVGVLWGDGDDPAGTVRPYMCTTAPDGSPGAAVFLDITQPNIRGWMDNTVGGLA
jgi:trypsin